jgi:hypothetical protein
MVDPMWAADPGRGYARASCILRSKMFLGNYRTVWSGLNFWSVFSHQPVPLQATAAVCISTGNKTQAGQ